MCLRVAGSRPEKNKTAWPGGHVYIAECQTTSNQPLRMNQITSHNESNQRLRMNQINVSE